nr:hypothetical protein [Micromonospora chersina]
MHGMHSAVEWLGFAVWEDGELVRSLTLSPDAGIRENTGEPYDFELTTSTPKLFTCAASG